MTSSKSKVGKLTTPRATDNLAALAFSWLHDGPLNENELFTTEVANVIDSGESPSKHRSFEKWPTKIW